MDDRTLHLEYRSITGPRTVDVVAVKQMGRIRYQVLANDERLAMAGTFFLSARKAMEEVEATLRRRYGEAAGELGWVFADGGAERAIAVADVGDELPD